MKRTGFKSRGKPLARTPFVRKEPPPLTKPRKALRKVSARTERRAAKIDLWYLAEVRKLPCVACANLGLTQTSYTQAHHPICGRYSTAKAPDRAAIPLCECCHQGLRYDRDRAKVAIHQGKETWVAIHGPDTQFIAQTQRAILGSEE